MGFSPDSFPCYDAIMPLAFESTTHGTFAFGFFNIRSDMLLLDNRFFFATDLCASLIGLAGRREDVIETEWDAWIIERPQDVGDLMGAIHGRRFTGFIGDTYRRYPFPAAPQDFRQAPEGDATQAELAEMIGRYGRRGGVRFAASREGDRVSMGGVEVSLEVFRELVRYVWRGGYPRWRGEVRPPYVVAMRAAIERGGSWLFAGIDWNV